MQSFQSALFRVAGDIRAHVAFWHHEDKTKGRKTLVFEPFDLQAGVDVVIDQFKPYALLNGSLRQLRLFNVALNIDRVRQWARTHASNPVNEIELRNLYPFWRGEMEGWLQRVTHNGYPESVLKFGRTRSMTREMVQEMERQGILIPSMFNPTEYQVLGQVIDRVRAS